MDKRTLYKQINEQAVSLFSGENDQIANMANMSAVLFTQLPSINWAGFYLFKNDELVLGPFQGNPACIRIPMGRGVCGTAAKSKQIQRIDDVHAFDGHIACDAASNSEIVIPLEKEGRLLGVLDIDSPVFARFDEVDEEGLVMLCNTLLASLK